MCGENVGMRAGGLDDVGHEDDVGMTDTLVDAVEEPSHTGTLQGSEAQ